MTILATGHCSKFSYDEMGRRYDIQELDPGPGATLQVTSDHKYLWDGTTIAEELDATGTTVMRQFFQQVFVDSDGTVLFYTRDHLGSIRELTDGTQTVRARYDYDPYGRMTKLQGDRTSPFGFTGDFWHAPSSLNLTLYRAYDPNIGRWISRDPIAEVGGENYYAYVENDPVDLLDPFGLCGWNPFPWIWKKLSPDKPKPQSPNSDLPPGWWVGLDGKPQAPEMKPWDPSKPTMNPDDFLQNWNRLTDAIDGIITSQNYYDPVHPATPVVTIEPVPMRPGIVE